MNINTNLFQHDGLNLHTSFTDTTSTNMMIYPRRHAEELGILHQSLYVLTFTLSNYISNGTYKLKLSSNLNNAYNNHFHI
jgi:hypothetical protein